MQDVINYEMTAYDQKLQFNTLQQEMTNAFLTSGAFQIKRILQLFPVISSSRRDMLRRSPLKFSFNEKHVATDYDTEQMLAFGDEALGQVYMSLPAHLTARVERNEMEGMITFILIDRIEMQINKLTEGGLNRSAFQNVLSMAFKTDVTITTLQDTLDSNKITNLVVYLAPKFNFDEHSNAFGTYLGTVFPRLPSPPIRMNSIASKKIDSTCCDGLFEDEWIVYKRKNDPTNTCNVTKINCIAGGQAEWEIVKRNFKKESDAEMWILQAGECREQH